MHVARLMSLRHIINSVVVLPVLNNCYSKQIDISFIMMCSLNAFVFIQQAPFDVGSRPPLLWRGCTRIPCGFVRPHVVVKNTNIYVGGGNAISIEISRTVFKYDTVNDSWSQLPISPYYTFALVLANGFVTTVGGVAVLSSLVTNKLGSFDEDNTKKWCHLLPAMPTERCVSSAVANKDHLIVVGGKLQGTHHPKHNFEVSSGLGSSTTQVKIQLVHVYIMC